MPDTSYRKEHVCQKHLREIFWEHRVWERYFTGEFNIRPKTYTRTPPFKIDSPPHPYGQELFFEDPSQGNKIVTKAQWFLDKYFEPAASGQPDPKQVTIAGVDSHLWRPGDLPCNRCPWPKRAWMRLRNLGVWLTKQPHRIKNECKRRYKLYTRPKWTGKVK